MWNILHFQGVCGNFSHNNIVGSIKHFYEYEKCHVEIVFCGLLIMGLEFFIFFIFFGRRQKLMVYINNTVTDIDILLSMYEKITDANNVTKLGSILGCANVFIGSGVQLGPISLKANHTYVIVSKFHNRTQTISIQVYCLRLRLRVQGLGFRNGYTTCGFHSF